MKLKLFSLSGVFFWFLIWAMFIIICFYSILDTLQTQVLLELGLKEGNPILCFFMSFCGFKAIVISKILTCGFLFITLLCVQIFQSRGYNKNVGNKS